MSKKSQYFGLTDLLKRYWKIYGGFSALLKSPYVHFSLLLTAITSHYWLNYAWWQHPISILPSLLGFTLGGFTIFLGFGDEKFKAIIAGNEPDEKSKSSPYLNFSVSFLHFVLLQLIALIWAIISSTIHFSPPGWLGCGADIFKTLDPIASGIGYWIFLYSICSAIAAGLSVFRLTFIFDSYITHTKSKPVNTQPDKSNIV